MEKWNKKMKKKKIKKDSMKKREIMKEKRRSKISDLESKILINRPMMMLCKKNRLMQIMKNKKNMEKMEKKEEKTSKMMTKMITKTQIKTDSHRIS